MDQKRIVGSSVAGISSTILLWQKQGHPLDTIKIHLQTNPNLHNSSLEAVKKLRFQVFRGMSPPLVNAIIMNSVMFSVFDIVQTKVNDPFISGIISGFATAIISTPTDYLKIQMQLKNTTTVSSILVHNNMNRNKIKTATSFIGRLYRGFHVNLAREGIFTMVYLGMYHWILQKEEINKNDKSNSNNNFNHIVFVTSTSAFTGALAWIITYPLDVVKTMIQSGNSNFQQIQTMINHGGIKVFYRGCIPSTGRAMLVTSSRMLAYDQIMIRYNTAISDFD